MTVKELIKLLKEFPDNAQVLVRKDHDDSYNPGDEGWEAVWSNGKRIFYCDHDNTVNVQ
jgi:hypothetical protein